MTESEETDAPAMSSVISAAPQQIHQQQTPQLVLPSIIHPDDSEEFNRFYNNYKQSHRNELMQYQTEQGFANYVAQIYMSQFDQNADNEDD